ncbi:hypothetical protein DB354_15650 [Opitutus sp. ER46]|nr:hypothetical protein DB354_15650 [Opitutus sp. ER46]
MYAVCLLAAAWAAASSGCTNVSSTARRTGVVAVGSAAGAAAGYLVSDGGAGPTAVGAVAGGAITQLALGEDASVRQDGFDQGYVQGQSDAIKRQYFLRLALERKPADDAKAAGEPVYYLVPGPEVTADGRKLAPHQVAIRVVE